MEFFEKTWLLWWVLADLAILRWFYLLCPRNEMEEELEELGVESRIAIRESSSPPRPIREQETAAAART